MARKLLRRLMLFVILVVMSLLTTFGSYWVVTGRNVPLDSLKDYATLNGEDIVNLPCYPADNPTHWQSDKPILPESRGLPFNYHFWNPCYGNKILRTGFLSDIVFWIVIYFILFVAADRVRHRRAMQHTH